MVGGSVGESVGRSQIPVRRSAAREYTSLNFANPHPQMQPPSAVQEPCPCHVLISVCHILLARTPIEGELSTGAPLREWAFEVGPEARFIPAQAAEMPK